MIRQDGYCAMYKQQPGEKYNFPYNGPAKLAERQTYEILSNICPDLTRNGPDDTKVCCGPKQAVDLKSQIQQANPLLSRCPAALKNFYDLWCLFTCSPNQSNFMSYGNGSGDWKANVYLSKNFSQSLYDSIEYVIFPATNGRVLDNMCGVKADQCTPDKFFGFIGQKVNGAPFNIQFHLGEQHNATNNSITNLNNKLLKCSDVYFDHHTGRNSSQCSCQDCPAVCPVPPIPPTPPPKHYIMGLEAHCFWTIIGLLIFILLFLAFNLIIVFTTARKGMAEIEARSDVLKATSVESSVSSNYKDTDALYGAYSDSGSLLVRLGIKTENLLQHAFRKWGTLCAYHPLIVILVSLVIISILSVGLIRFTVVTNPVDLWSAPDSQAREEKNYYDKRFTPFYRNEQVILTTTYNYSDQYKVYQKNYHEFMGMMHKEILEEVCKGFYDAVLLNDFLTLKNVDAFFSSVLRFSQPNKPL